MEHLFCYLVCLEQCQVRVYFNIHGDVQCMPNQARAYLCGGLDTLNTACHFNDAGHDARIYRIEQTLEDAARGAVNDAQDDQRNNQARDGVGEWQAQPDAD